MGSIAWEREKESHARKTYGKKRSEKMIEGTNSRTLKPIVARYRGLASQFENLAETYRDVRLHGAANDAESRKHACETLARESEKAAA
jgi:hypothetical protein